VNGKNTIHVSVIGAGSAYGIFLVKWAYQLLRDPKSNRENLPLPTIGSISYSNTNDRNRDLVLEVLQDDLHRMPGFEQISLDELKKNVRGYTRWREMIRQEKPDLVVVCSPTETHVATVRELITDFGIKNILCENPITPLQDSDSLPGLERLIKEEQVTFGVNLQYAALGTHLKDVNIHPQEKNSLRFGQLTEGLTSAEVTFITHGTRPWRQFSHIGEQVVLEDLGTHALYFLPPSVWTNPVTVKKVHREGDNLFLNLVEYELAFGDVPVRMVLGYRRKLKSLKVLFHRNNKDYEFHMTGATNPETGEYTRWIEGKNYAYPFRYALRTDLVKYSFMHSLMGRPLVGFEEALKNHAAIRQIFEGSTKLG
jgi:predicted dehydrogenase